MAGPTIAPARVAEEPVADSAVPRFALTHWNRYGVTAGVTGRGDPEHPFDLGLSSAQPFGAGLGRWRQLADAVPGFDGIVVARQVHGTAVLWHDRARGLSIVEDADGHATARPGILLAVTLADCIPIYLVDPVRRAVALLHSGWRGTAAWIVRAGVECLVREAGSSVSDIVMHCGVGICSDCYEVDSQVAVACGRPASGRSGLDLRTVIADQAASLGLSAVTISTRCSAHESSVFFSHRRSGGTNGRMVAYLGIGRQSSAGAAGE